MDNKNYLKIIDELSKKTHLNTQTLKCIFDVMRNDKHLKYSDEQIKEYILKHYGDNNDER